ncbi:hypothetical protein AB0J38_24915 [Streptomyces sp. NPDC050095]|uniref:hypothetical protein n=1 Tax=unclassified Streptomyces TaxID=2593676 RepID=UPI00342D2FCF
MTDSLPDDHARDHEAREEAFVDAVIRAGDALGSPPSPDYRIDGYRAATDEVEDDFVQATLDEDTFVELAVHHSDDDHTYMVFFDGSATWDIPGTSAYRALHITRDVAARTFTFAASVHPTVPFAQNWLIQRGCPANQIDVTNPDGPRPADADTSRLEQQLRTSGTRYRIIDTYTHDPVPGHDGGQTWILTQDQDPVAHAAPYRLFVEETTLTSHQYTLREGAFTTVEEARRWLNDPTTPLPPAPPSPANATARRAPQQGTPLALPPRPVAPPRPPHRR